ncbi:hypothetical protein E2C01_094754 [Portunus trituberculatus]|uniref:Uncharacterized protein n=1 Tax=Portunus trituberculatus TaxID=210409 RepID=A0A5B7JXQ9_PORTR|nr:hypothetical protein [Portunus trituberculatus]
MNQNELEWVVTRGGRVGTEWDVRKWKSEIDKDVKSVGLNEWRNEMERKTTLKWYKVKEAPIKGCQMSDSEEGETVEHVMLECVKYARDRSCRSKGPGSGVMPSRL